MMRTPSVARTTAKPWGGGGNDGEVATDAEHHEGVNVDGCDDRGTGMAVTVAIHKGGDVGGDRDEVDDAVSAGILDSDGDGITGHGDDGVVPPPASNARRGGGATAASTMPPATTETTTWWSRSTMRTPTTLATMGRRWRRRRRTPRQMRRPGGWR